MRIKLKLLGIISISFAATTAVVAVDISEYPGKSGIEYIKTDVKKAASDKAWKQYETRTLDMLSGFQPYSRKIKLDKYGGRTDMAVQAKGFFYPKKNDGRVWLIDPEGHPFLHVGLVAVSMGSKTGKQVAMNRFGSEEKWAQFSAWLLKKYGFNGSGGWSQTNLLEKTGYPPVYTLSWNFMADFAASKKLAWQVSGHKGYPNMVWPVFHPEFEQFCDAYAKKLSATKDDPYCLGHFSDNELQTRPDMLDRTLRLDETKYSEMKYNVEAARQWLDARKGQAASLEDINDTDRAAFTEYMFERYFQVTTAAIRKYDSNHLCLGSRLNGAALKMPEVFRAAGKYVDVVGVNYYNAWTPDKSLMKMWSTESGKPFIITEWYVKGEDSGLSNTTGAGWLVKTQKDRAHFYQNFTLGLMENKDCVGWHWFKYTDNNPDDSATDPSNRDSNKGVLTYDYKPYLELLDEMKRINDNVYSLIDYFDLQ